MKLYYSQQDEITIIFVLTFTKQPMNLFQKIPYYEL